MRLSDLALLAGRQMVRHRTRSLLTVLGVATGIFLYTAVQTVQAALAAAVDPQAADHHLVVFRANRFCPNTSRLPEHYGRQIAALPGVRWVVPIQVLADTCAVGLDAVTFRGLPEEDIETLLEGRVALQAADLAAWRQRRDAVLVGDVLARRRGLRPGDTFGAAGIEALVVAILPSSDAASRNLAYAHLDYLQQAGRTGLGVVTQFSVVVEDGADHQAVAAAIDDLFAADTDPTTTRLEHVFLMQTAGTLVEMIGFTRWIALAAVLAVLALVANTLLLSVRARVREAAVLQTLGFTARHLAGLVLIEGALLALLGGLAGTLSAGLVLHHGAFALTAEGHSLVFSPTAAVLAGALGIAAVLGLVAAAVPAWQATRGAITDSLRTGG